MRSCFAHSHTQQGWDTCKNLQGVNGADSRASCQALLLMPWSVWHHTMYCKAQRAYSAGRGPRGWCMCILTNATACCTSQRMGAEMPACHSAIATFYVRKYMYSNWSTENTQEKACTSISDLIVLSRFFLCVRPSQWWGGGGMLGCSLSDWCEAIRENAAAQGAGMGGLQQLSITRHHLIGQSHAVWTN